MNHDNVKPFKIHDGTGVKRRRRSALTTKMVAKTLEDLPVNHFFILRIEELDILPSSVPCTVKRIADDLGIKCSCLKGDEPNTLHIWRNE